MIPAFVFTSVDNYRFVKGKQVQSAGILKSCSRSTGCIYTNRSLKRFWKPFIIIWTTWYNLRKCAVEQVCTFTSIHVKNHANLQLISSRLSRLFLETRWRQFRKWSAISRKLSYPLWSDDNRTLLFHFSVFWLVPKTTIINLT